MTSRKVKTSDIFLLASKKIANDKIADITGVPIATISWLMTEYWDIDAKIPEWVESTELDSPKLKRLIAVYQKTDNQT